MKQSAIGFSAGALAAVLLLAQAAHAQDPASGLQDLVGAKGSSGEQALQQRGYTFVKGEKSGSDSYTYWRQRQSGQCISVRTAEGRYQSLVTTPSFDCQGGSAGGAPAKGSDAQPSHFATVCGVTVEGKPYRYKCTVDGVAPGKKGKTVLHYPDQNITLDWHGNKRVGVTFEGMKEKQTSYRTSEGSTQFVFEGKTYFYVSDPGAAEMEVKNFRGQ
jgi:hypothetical protein